LAGPRAPEQRSGRVRRVEHILNSLRRPCMCAPRPRARVSV